MSNALSKVIAEFQAQRLAFWNVSDLLAAIPTGQTRDLLEQEARARIGMAQALVDQALAMPAGSA